MQRSAMPAIAGASQSPLIVFAGGGTGGHLYPALAVAREIRERIPRARIRFFGTDRPIDARILADTGFDLLAQRVPRISAAPWRWPGVAKGFADTSRQCRSDFRRDRPSVVMGTGGAGSASAVREAHRMGIPTALFNPDVIPGRANRFLAGRVDVILVQWEQSRSRFTRARTTATDPRTNVRVTGCPVRRSFLHASRDAGVRRFGLDPARKTLLITGASQGARTINEAVVANIELLRCLPDWQTLHLTGQTDHARVCDAYASSGYEAVVLPFTDQMADAIASADLVVSRAGASTLAELAAVGRASVLMPYPYHKDMHQLANAKVLEGCETGPAARILRDGKDVRDNAPRLGAELHELMTCDHVREAMQQSAKRIGCVNATARVADELLELAGLTADAVAAVTSRPIVVSAAARAGESLEPVSGSAR